MLRAVATDGHRLAQAQIDAPAGAEAMAGVIVPRKTVGEIQKLVEDPARPRSTIEISDTKIRFTIGAVVLTSKLIDGTFPDYVRVIPQGNDKMLKVDRGEFAERRRSRLDHLDRARPRREARARRRPACRSRSTIRIPAAPPRNSASTIPPTPSRSASTRATCSTSPAQLETGTAEFRFADPGSPTLIQDDGDADALYVLMPMRV